jgi:dienelactone hydrolase
MHITRKRALVLALPLVLLLAAAGASRPYLRAAAFVIQASGMEGHARTAAGLEANAYDERPLTVPWRGGQLRARLYTPRGAFDRAVLLVPGVHAAGVDEPRLVQFARDLASVRHTVLTVELPDLTQYRVTPRTTDMIEDAALWLSRQAGLAPDGRVGMMGISFAGGLSVIAASRPSIRERTAFVMSFGGHGDLARTLRYLCTGIQPDGTHRPPHDYGVAIILLTLAERIVPADQAAPLRTAILTFLDGSRLDMVDKARAAAEFERARALAAALPEPSRTLMRQVNERDIAELGDDTMVSPVRAAAPACPVYLLHGTDDNVIPAIESALLADALHARGVTVHHLATPLITHAEVDRSAAILDVWRLVRFWAGLLAE